MPRNNAKRWAFISLVITLIGVLLLFTGITRDDSDYMWMIIVGFMLALTFLICFFVFLSQARHLDRLFSREELMAHWFFDQGQHLQKAQQEYEARKKGNRAILLIIIAFFVVIGGLFAVFGFDDLEDAAGFLLVMFGIMVLISLVALLAPGAAYRKMIRSVPEVYVGPFGAWIMGEYVQWKAAMTRPRQVVFEQLPPEEGQGVRIAVHYEIRQRYMWQPHVSRIPVPAGQEQVAYQVAMNIATANQIQFLA